MMASHESSAYGEQGTSAYRWFSDAGTNFLAKCEPAHTDRPDPKLSYRGEPILIGGSAMKKILPGMLMIGLIVFFAVVQYALAAPSPP
jgi:hypothetical protein